MARNQRFHEFPPDSGNLEDLYEWSRRMVRRWIIEDAEGFLTLDDTGTPSVISGDKWLTGGTTTITDFDDGTEAQELTVVADHSVTIQHGTNINLYNDENWDMVSGDVLRVIQKADGNWYEIGRGGEGGGDTYYPGVTNPLELGTDDDDAGIIKMYGGGAGEDGAYQEMYVGADYDGGADSSGTYEAGTGTDDGYWLGSGTFTDTGNLLWGADGTGNTRNPFVCFDPVNIPQGSRITSAVIRFTAEQSFSSTTTKCTIYFQDEDDASPPTSKADGEGKSLTSGVNWTIPATTAGETFDSPELRTILQTVIDRAGYSSGNAICAQLRDNGSSNNTIRDAYSYDDDTAKDAQLIVSYNSEGKAVEHYTWQVEEDDFVLKSDIVTEDKDLIKVSYNDNERFLFDILADVQFRCVEAIKLLEKSSDPDEPSEGEAIIWMSDGTGKGDDGDIMIASKAGGTTNYGTLFDHSAGSGW